MDFANQMIDLLNEHGSQKARIESLEAENRDLASRLDGAQKVEKRLSARVKRLERKSEGMTLDDEEFLWGHRHVEIVLSNTPEGARRVRMRFGGPMRPQIRAESTQGNPVLSHAFRKLREDFGELY